MLRTPVRNKRNVYRENNPQVGRIPLLPTTPKLVNTCVDAAENMGKGGKITIKVNTKLDETRMASDTAPRDALSSVKLDSGAAVAGMKADAKAVEVPAPPPNPEPVADSESQINLHNHLCESVTNVQDSIAASVESAAAARGFILEAAASPVLPEDDHTTNLIMSKIIPAMTEIVTTAINESTKQILQFFNSKFEAQVMSSEKIHDLESKIESLEKENESLKKIAINNKIEAEKHQMYSRKESIRIFGVHEMPGEDTNEIVRQVAEDVGVHLLPSDISISHRLPVRNPSNQSDPRGEARASPIRPIICRFTRRDVKNEILRKKRNLRSVARGANVYIHEDLTSIRQKMLRVIKKDMETKKINGDVWSRDGVICVKIVGEEKRTKFINMDGPGELYKLGWSFEDVKKSGLLLE